MIVFRLFGVKIYFEFSFFFTVSIISLYNEEISGKALIACILHEMGHIFAMNFEISSVTFSASGIKIVPKGYRIKSLREEILILLAGPFVNFILFIIFGVSEFGIINLVLMIYNLLPINSLDGGRILKSVTEYYLPQSSYYICKAVGIAVSFMIIPIMILSGVNNISVIISLGFIIISAFYTT